jgi:hypothetical protein
MFKNKVNLHWILALVAITLPIAIFRDSGISLAQGVTNAVPSIRLGSTNQPPGYAGVDAPQPVAELAKKVLGGDPATWDVNNITNFGGFGKHVVSLSGDSREILICLVQSNQWFRLNEKAGIPFINDVLEGYLKSPSCLTNGESLEEWLDALGFMYKGGGRIALDAYRFRGMEQRYRCLAWERDKRCQVA